MVKKYAIEVGATAVALAAVAFLMMTANVFSTLRADAAATSTINQTVVRIDNTGKALVRGTIESVAPGTITVKSWGGTWTADIAAGAQILPALANDDIFQFKPGDYVGVQGTVDANANWAIDATLVRDWTFDAMTSAEKKQNLTAAREAALATPKNYTGIASGVNGQSFTLTIRGVMNTVNAASDAEVVNRNWLALPIGSIRDGDSIRVWGVNASGTISATIVRDTSLPATSTAP
jgi:hypothetical protein